MDDKTTDDKAKADRPLEDKLTAHAEDVLHALLDEIAKGLAHGSADRAMGIATAYETICRGEAARGEATRYGRIG